MIFYDMTLSTGKQRRHMIKHRLLLYTRTCTCISELALLLPFVGDEHTLDIQVSDSGQHVPTIILMKETMQEPRYIHIRLLYLIYTRIHWSTHETTLTCLKSQYIFNQFYM